MVGESGIFTPDDIAYVQEAGVKAVSTFYPSLLALHFLYDSKVEGGTVQIR